MADESEKKPQEVHIAFTAALDVFRATARPNEDGGMDTEILVGEQVTHPPTDPKPFFVKLRD